MKKWILLSSLAILVISFRTVDHFFWKPRPADITTAVDKSLALLQPSSRMFLENAGTCHSCHHQDLTAISLHMAKQKGHPINDTIYQEAVASITATLKSRKAVNVENSDPVAIVMSGSYSLWALAEIDYPANKNMELLAKNLLQRQTAEGSWVSPNPRPPLEYYAFTATALVVRSIQAYAPAALRADAQQRIEKAKAWMMREIPETNEEKAFQLLGLSWAGGDAAFIRQQAKKLIAAQRPDGGWPQLDSLTTDAYATGQNLYALFYSGQLRPGDEAFQKGIAFLLKTQQEDGSWRIQSRSFPGVPFVETGFPKGGDQFISAAGSNWATMALLLAEK